MSTDEFGGLLGSRFGAKERRALKRQVRRDLIALRREHKDMSAAEFRTFAEAELAKDYGDDDDMAGLDIPWDQLWPVILKFILELLPLLL